MPSPPSSESSRSAVKSAPAAPPNSPPLPAAAPPIAPPFADADARRFSSSAVTPSSATASLNSEHTPRSAGAELHRASSA
eukprot:242924-Chlamydomonas_euryale.AAC.2